MARNVTAQIASLVLAALMTVGMLGSIDGFAKSEAGQAAAGAALVAQAGQPAARA
ncbi:MAG TPA: hypothetical protein VIP05_16250 [Burkholderiaceae bacterium]